MTASRRPCRRGLAAAGLLAGALVAGSVAACDGDSGPPPAEVRIVSQNVLHGIACPPETNRCALPERMQLLARQLDAGDCPPIVALQEVNREVVDALRDPVAGVCDGRYELVWDDDPGLDRELVLTTLPVRGSGRTKLAGPVRTALWVRIEADVGPVDVVVTHLASSGDDRPCDQRTCPPPCEVADSLNACQMRQALAFLDAQRADDGVAFLVGDLNAQPDESTVALARDAGLVDTHLAAGNPECDEQTGAQCTSGRDDQTLADLTDGASQQTERLDYVWLATERDCDVVDPTGLFDPEPARDGQAGLAFASDHTGVQATVRCATTEAQRAAGAVEAPAPPTTPSRPRTPPDSATAAAITAAYQTFFDGTVTDIEAKLAVLEDAEVLRDLVVSRYEQVAPLAAQTRVRIEDIALVGPDEAEVTFSLVVAGSTALDQVPGRAVRSDGGWLVARSTYCDVASLGASSVPEVCAAG